MNKAKFIEGLNETISGLTTLRDALSEGGATTKAAETTPTTKATKKTSTAAPAAKPQTDVAPGTTGKFDPDQLNSMPYNEFKKLAAKLGVSCKGTRDEIMARVMALDITFDENGEAIVGDTPAENETTPAAPEKKLGKKSPAKTAAPAPGAKGDEQKSDKPVGGKRGLVKKAVRPAEDEFDAKAKEIAGDTSVEEIIEALSDVGMEATTDDYLTKLAAALREGKLEVDDDPTEGDEGENPAEAEQEEGDITAESYFPEYDPHGFNDPANMSEARQEAITSKMDEILTDYSEGNLAPQDVQDYLTEKATQDELDLLGDDPSDDEMLKAYMELVKRTIDNDGVEHTEDGDPYEVGDVDMCCAHPLKKVAKTGKYICEMCGTEFEAE